MAGNLAWDCKACSEKLMYKGLMEYIWSILMQTTIKEYILEIVLFTLSNMLQWNMLKGKYAKMFDNKLISLLSSSVNCRVYALSCIKNIIKFDRPYYESFLNTDFANKIIELLKQSIENIISRYLKLLQIYAQDKTMIANSS